MQTPKGTRDFYPEDQRIQNYLFQTWTATCIEFGYEEYEGPMFEHLELYTGKSGNEIVTQLYNFQDKGGRDLALRPEMTPTLARMVNQRSRELKKPFKWYSIPRLFRYERAQKGRLREFFQLNMDIIGTDSLYAELDLIAAIIHMLRKFGLSATDFCVGISSRKLLAALLAQRNLLNPEEILPILDKKAKIPAEKFQEDLQTAKASLLDVEFLTKLMESAGLAELHELCATDEAKQAWSELDSLFQQFDALGLKEYVSLDLSVVRGLAYYTGVVFEVFDRSKSMRAIAGGGRYDNLCARLGGAPVTGVGFGVGDVVLKDLLQEKGLLPEVSLHAPELFLVKAGSPDLLPLFKWASQFRQAGTRVAHTLQFQKLGKQLEAAARSGAAKVVFITDDVTDTLEIKELATGNQYTTKSQELLL
jgi:histidyl-tRNA synthetase